MRILHKHFDLLIVLFCTIIATVFGILFIGLKGFSMDELDTMFITSSWPTMLHFITYTEGNMWLYYFVLYFWKFFGNSEFYVRLLSVVFASTTIPVAYFTAKKLFNKYVAVTSILLLSFHVFFISNAQNARAYTMVLFFTTLSSLFFIQYVQKQSRKYLFFATIVNALAVYCHLYALFIIASQILSLVFTNWKSKWKDVVLNGILLVVLILPLFIAPSMHSGQVNWIARPDIKNLIGTYLILANDYPIIGGIELLLIGGFVITVLKKWSHLRITDRTWNYGFLFLWILFPIILSFIFSLIAKPLYISAYFFVCLVPFTIFIALCITKITYKWIQAGFIFLILLLSLIRLSGWYFGSKHSGLVIRNYNEDFKGTAAFLRTHVSGTDGIIFLPSSTQDKVNFYITQQKYPALTNEITLQPDYVTTGSFNFTIDRQKLALLPKQYTKIWYILETVTDNRVDTDNTIIIKSLKKNYSVKYIYRLEAITIFEYAK